MAGEAIPSGTYTWMQGITRTILEGQSTGSRSLTYKRQTAESYDATTQTNTPTWSDTSVTGTRHDRASTPVGTEDEGAQAGDVGYQVDKARLAFDPKTSDRIVDGSDTYEVLDYHEDPLALYWVFHCRKVAA